LPTAEAHLWALVAEDQDEEGKERVLVLLTNVPIHSMGDAQGVYSDWRMRGRIEQGYRFDQEQGLDVEDMRVRTIERMRRMNEAYVCVGAVGCSVRLLLDEQLACLCGAMACAMAA
jgi:hypothetical protein